MRRITFMVLGGIGLASLTACGLGGEDGGGGGGGGGGGPVPGVLGFAPGPTMTIVPGPGAFPNHALVNMRLADHDADGTADLLYALKITTLLNDYYVESLQGLGTGAFVAAYPGQGWISGDGIIWMATGNVLGPTEPGFAFLAVGPKTWGFRDVGGTPTRVGGSADLLTFFAGIAVGDFDGDGTDDVAANDVQNGNLLRWYTQGDRSLLPAPAVDLPGGGGANGLAAGDWDGDGDDDVLVAYFSLAGVATFIGPQAGVVVPITGIEGFFDPVTGDFDGDGVTDVAGLGFATGLPLRIVFLRGLGNGTFAGPVFTTPSGFTITVAGGTSHLQVADFDADGKSDLAVIAPGERVGVFLGTATGVFDPFHDVDLVDPGSDTLAVGDVDGDGDVDLVVGDASSLGLRSLLNERF